MRMFLGIPVGLAAATELAVLAERLQAATSLTQANELRWSAPDTWHITLQFLGSVTPGQFDCVASRLRSFSARSFPVTLSDLGAFDRAGVLYARVQPSAPLLMLQQSILELTGTCGFHPEDRPYHPHITLARRRGRHSSLLSALGQQPFAAAWFTAEQVVLYESVPTPGGSRYVPREIAPLSSTST